MLSVYYYYYYDLRQQRLGPVAHGGSGVVTTASTGLGDFPFTSSSLSVLAFRRNTEFGSADQGRVTVANNYFFGS